MLHASGLSRMYNAFVAFSIRYTLVISFIIPTSFSPGYKTFTRSAKICLSRKCTGISPFGVSGITFSRPWQVLAVGVQASSNNLTIFSNTHLFKILSGLRHSHKWWLLLSRHCQCFLKASEHFSLMSFSLRSMRNIHH